MTPPTKRERLGNRSESAGVNLISKCFKFLKLEGGEQPEMLLFKNPDSKQSFALFRFAAEIEVDAITGIKVDAKAKSITFSFKKGADRVLKSGDKAYEALFWYGKLKAKMARKAGGGKIADLLSDAPGAEKIDINDIVSVDRFRSKYEELMRVYKGLETMTDKEKPEGVLAVRRLLIEMDFFVDRVYTIGNVEIIDGKLNDPYEIYRQFEVERINLTEVAKGLGGVKGQLDVLKLKYGSTAAVKIAEGATVSTAVAAAVKDGEEGRLYRHLEKMRDSISVRNFLKLSLEDRLKLASNLKSLDNLKEEKLLVFNFGSNAKLQYQIGLGDLMPKTFRAISVGGTEYKRRANQGFYSGGKYLAIWSGTEVKVTDVDDKYDPVAEYSNKFGDYAAAATDETVKGRDISKREIYEMAVDFGIDAHFLEAVFSILTEDNSNGINDPYEFLHIAGRYLQNAEARYSDKVMGDGNYYSPNFMVYALDRFSLFNNYTGRNARTYDIIKKYDELRTDVEIKFSKADIAKAEQVRNHWSKTEYSASDVVAGSPVEWNEQAAKVVEDRVKTLRASLLETGFKGDIERTIANARIIYKAMIVRQGFLYKRKVSIRGWNITNSCVGHTMKVMENTDFVLQKGRQKGKHASQYYWGRFKDGKMDVGYKEALIGSGKVPMVRGLTPSNADALIGPFLRTGEPAVASLWDHVFWIWKKKDGTIMMSHSGADVRPGRVSVSEAGGVMPPGYVRKGDYYHKLPKSKVNELPLGYFLSKKQNRYGKRNHIKILSLSQIVENNSGERLVT